MGWFVYPICTKLSFHFKLSKNLITTVSIIGLATIFIFHFLFWNDSRKFIYRKRKENVDEMRVTFVSLFFSNDPHKSSLWFLCTLYQSWFVFAHMESLHQLHILVEFVTSWDHQWWPLTFQSESPHSSKISELIQPGESLRFLVPLGGRVCPSTA